MSRAGGQEFVQDGEIRTLNFYIVHSFSGECKIGVVCSSDKALLDEIPRSEIEIFARETHASLNFFKRHSGDAWVGATSEIENCEQRHTPV